MNFKIFPKKIWSIKTKDFEEKIGKLKSLLIIIELMVKLVMPCVLLISIFIPILFNVQELWSSFGIPIT